MRCRRSLMSISLVLSFLVLSDVLTAADDDVVIESAGGSRGRPVCAPTEAAIEQAVKSLEDQFLRDLDHVAQKCSLTPQQIEKAKIAGRRDIRLFVREKASRPVLEAEELGKDVYQVPSNIRITVSANYFLRDETFASNVLITQMTRAQLSAFRAIKMRGGSVSVTMWGSHF